MTCVKQVVKAVIIAVDGTTYTGYNSCENPQSVCPRELAGMKTGEGYELCKTVCGQKSHAEISAITLAGEDCKGATLYLTGHDYACQSCKDSATKAGIKSIVIY